MLSPNVRTLYRLFALLCVFLGGCGGGTEDNREQANFHNVPHVASLEIVPGTAMLTPANRAKKLIVRAVDYQGRPVLAPVAWASSNPEIIRVSNDGTVTALRNSGSAQITASFLRTKSKPVTVFMATPAPGVILLRDSQINTDPSILNPKSTFSIGSRYQLMLKGVPPPPLGKIILGAEGKSVMGRVVSSRAVGAGQATVVLEMVPLKAVFSNLQIKQSYRPGPGDVKLPERLKAYYDLKESPQGEIQLIPKKIVSSGEPHDAGLGDEDQGAFDREGPAATPMTKFKRGIFQCQASSPAAIDGFDVSPSMKFDIGVDFEYDSKRGGLQRLMATGKVELESKAEVKIKQGLALSMDCGTQVTEIPIPVGGPLAFITGAAIPLGVGVKFGAEGTTQTFGVGFQARAQATDLHIGVICRPDQNPDRCKYTSGGKISTEAKADRLSDIPGADTPKIELNFFPYAYGEIVVGPKWMRKINNNFGFEAMEFNVGPEFKGSLTSAKNQARDPSYEAKYWLNGVYKASTQIGEKYLLDIFDVKPIKFEAGISKPEGTSPEATAIVADKQTMKIGEEVSIKVNLNPKSLKLFLLNNLKTLSVYQASTDRFIAFKNITGAPATVSINFKPVSEGAIDGDLYIFASTSIFPSYKFELGSVKALKLPTPTLPPIQPPSGDLPSISANMVVYPEVERGSGYNRKYFGIEVTVIPPKCGASCPYSFNWGQIELVCRSTVVSHTDASKIEMATGVLANFYRIDYSPGIHRFMVPIGYLASKRAEVDAWFDSTVTLNCSDSGKSHFQISRGVGRIEQIPFSATGASVTVVGP